MLPHDFLNQWLPDCGETRSFCEILMQHCPESGHFVAVHQSNQECDRKTLCELKSHQEIQQLAEFTQTGEKRPIKTAPNLKDGWIICSASVEDFALKVDSLYPGALADTALYFSNSSNPTAFRDISNAPEEITDAQINQVMRDTCFRGCLRRIAWPIDDQCSVSRLPNPNRRIPAVCNQACEFALQQAQQLFD